jgi:hypothetical protein
MAYKKFANVKLGECEHCGKDVYRHDSFVVHERMFPSIKKEYLCHNSRDKKSCFTEFTRSD